MKPFTRLILHPVIHVISLFDETSILFFPCACGSVF
jgi:hypothetical protein